ncbi:MAG: Rpn family recombination-promoting nuclease/putative transposase, partial [Spirochaetaceae bacterium]|nr:Rpn family recombination-promoting nuclease/putative transposase [Spirochaetaceae bacterium]
MHTVVFDSDADIPDLRYDAAFKAVFARETPQSRKALTGLLSACIGHQVSVISLIANEPAPGSVWDKQIRYDIACCLDSGELVDVEMTLHPSPSEPCREEYYAAKLFTSQDIRGSQTEYLELKNIYQINILSED